jgi:hypothetical protein
MLIAESISGKEGQIGINSICRNEKPGFSCVEVIGSSPF